jgi:hypothetical protein
VRTLYPARVVLTWAALAESTDVTPPVSSRSSVANAIDARTAPTQMRVTATVSDDLPDMTVTLQFGRLVSGA